MLIIDGVSKTLDGKEIIKNVNLKVKEGSIVGIIGVNGAGKSTLLRCISGVYKVDEGKITLGKDEIYENETIKKDILFLSDNPSYSSRDTMKTLKNYYQVFYPNFDEDKYQEYLVLTHVDENEYLRNLSKGMRRQAFMILMLSLRPKLLLLDESFDGLDSLMKGLMKRAVSNLIVDEEAIVLISSHNINDIESICDHYLIMDKQTIQGYEDMENNKEAYHRIQLAFNHEVKLEDFKSLNLVDIEIRSKIVVLVAEGDKEEIEKQVKAMNPILMESLDLSLEELFVSKIKGGKENE